MIFCSFCGHYKSDFPHYVVHRVEGNNKGTVSVGFMCIDCGHNALEENKK